MNNMKLCFRIVHCMQYYIFRVQCGLPSISNNPLRPFKRIAGGQTSTPGAQPWSVSIR